jgi:hypothetical protein
MGNEVGRNRRYRVFWRDRLLLLKVGRKDAHIDQRLIVRLLDGRGHCGGYWICH